MDPFEKLLRDQIETPAPRSGMASRIQASVRSARENRDHPSRSWIGLGALSMVTLVGLILVFAGPNSPEEMTEQSPPQPSSLSLPEVTLAMDDTPVHQEIRGLQKDTRKAISFFSGMVPSVTKVR